MRVRLGRLLLAAGAAIIVASVALAVRTYYRGSFSSHFTMAAEIRLTPANLPEITIPLPPQLNRAADIAVFFLFVFFLAFAGGRLGALGTALLRDPKVPGAAAGPPADP